MRKLIVANFKMNGDSEFYRSYIKNINKRLDKDTNFVLCPPFVYLSEFSKLKNKNAIGCQDIANIVNTKSTGQISPKMLKEFDVKYAVVGHSERRANGETDNLIAEKVDVCLSHEISPIICVGEPKKSSKIDYIINQVKIALSKNKNDSVIFAYEPIWAIGTGDIPTISKINKAIDLIKNTAKEMGANVQVLYGGSVNKENYIDLLNSKADGFLLGGVSLKVDDYIEIVKGCK